MLIAAALAATLNWQMSAATLQQSCAAALTRARTRVVHARAVLPVEEISSDLYDETASQRFLAHVATDRGLQAAARECEGAVSSFYSDLTASPEIYAQIMHAAGSGTAKNPYDRALLSIWLDRFKSGGAALSPARRSEFVALRTELHELERRFQQNLLAETAVPAFLRLEPDEAARRASYFAYYSRAAAANTPLLERAIQIRDRLAHLLGFQTWAAYRLSTAMAQSPHRVWKFLDSLDDAVLPEARAGVARLQALKAEKTGNPKAVLQPWDYDYYEALSRPSFSDDFPVQHVVDATLSIYHTFLGVNFRKTMPSNAWNPDVLKYSVSDAQTGRLIGVVYLDLSAPPHKDGSGAVFRILPVRRLSDGSYCPAVAALVVHWPLPAPTFFGEFGSAMAALLATAPYETLSKHFVRDFAEAPSQLMETLAWQPAILEQLSSDRLTGAPLPDTMIDSLVQAHDAGEAYDIARQIMYAEIDLAYHSSGPRVDTSSFWQILSTRLTPLPDPEGVEPQAEFADLMDGRDVSSYGVLWSKLYAQDMFTAFLKGGLESPSVGLRYREDILQPARTYDPDREVERFLGRPVNPEEMMMHLVLAASFALASTTFRNNTTLPQTAVYNRFGCNGANISPELHWTAPPRGTRSFALIAFDPDATGGWYHWVVYNLPAATRSLPAGASLPAAELGTTSFQSRGYGGPCPPPGKIHHYIFTLYALDLQTLPGTRLPGVWLQIHMANHILARATITGLYRR